MIRFGTGGWRAIIGDDFTRENVQLVATGILKYARLIDTSEFMDLISLVRLGAVKGIINMDCAQIEALMIHMQPATISLSVDRPLDRVERDKLRAMLVRQNLG